MHLKVALGATIVAIGLIAGSWGTEWYRINYTGSGSIINPNYNQKFYWDHVVTKINDGDDQNHKYTEDPELTHIKQTFDTCLTFLTVGGAVLVGAAVINILRLFFDFKGKFWAYIVIIGTIAAEVLLCISFFTFLNIKQAFTQDKWGDCREGLLSTDYNKNMCDRIIGKNTDSGTLEWLPGVGWWLLLGAIVFGSIASGENLKSGKNNF